MPGEEPRRRGSRIRAGLKPYASFVVLELTGGDQGTAVAELRDWLVARARKSRGEVELMVGEDELLPQVAAIEADIALDEVSGFTYRRASTPGWLKSGDVLVDVRNELALILRHEQYLALHVSHSNIKDSLYRWLDSSPKPRFRRVDGAILKGAFLQGAARGLWLAGTHPISASKADSKNLSGPDLAESLNPFEDGTFALRAARARATADGGFEKIEGTIGTTPANALVWNGVTSDLGSFLAIGHEVLCLVADTAESDGGVDSPYPVLAEHVGSLEGVGGAYEIGVSAAGDLPQTQGEDDDLREAAELLENAALEVHGHDGSPHFSVDVGVGGSIAGRLRCRVHHTGGRVGLDFGYEGAPTDDLAAREVLSALQYSDLLTIHYGSGHSVHRGEVYLSELREWPFPHWEFRSFEGFDIGTEKPAKAHSEIHRLVGEPEDRSLFGWVVREFGMGHLTCDDGSGEIADFVNWDGDRCLRLIHVKASTNGSANRPVSGADYEVVASQAGKGIGFLNRMTLLDRLSAHLERATWRDGARVPDRSELVASVGGSWPPNKFVVMIVQPRLRESVYRSLRDASGAMLGADGDRLRRLETLLNSLNGSIAGAGGRLVVVGSS